MTTWDQAKEAWQRSEQTAKSAVEMGHAAVLQAAQVGQMLIELKEVTPHGEFEANVTRVSQIESGVAARKWASRLMTLGRNLPLLEQQRPASQRAALALIAETKRPVPPVAVATAAPAFAVVDECQFDGENSYGPRRAMSAEQDAALAVWVEALAVFRAATVEVMRYDVNTSDMLEAIGIYDGGEKPVFFYHCLEEADALPSKVGLLEGAAQ